MALARLHGGPLDGQIIPLGSADDEIAVHLYGEASAREVCERVLRYSGLDILPGMLDRSGNEFVSAVKHVHAGVPH